MMSLFNDDRLPKGATRPLADAPPIDRAKVARLRRALAAGTYRVDPERVAEAMIATDRLGSEETK